jgi:hypothetical protein
MEEDLKKRDRSKERMLPSDFLHKIKYDSLDDSDKEIISPEGGFFKFPEDVKGQMFKDRDFLVFYFDSEPEYEMVRTFFENTMSNAHSHPDLITAKLVQLVADEVNKND